MISIRILLVKVDVHVVGLVAEDRHGHQGDVDLKNINCHLTMSFVSHKYFCPFCRISEKEKAIPLW